jgi:hypothetical protein
MLWHSPLARAFAILTALLVCKVTLSAVIGYRNYLPPDFETDFLLGREAYFWGAYAWAFYVHLVAGPVALLLGTLLVSDRFRSLTPLWHRRLGRVQAAVVLLLLVPSSLWMARHAATGTIAAWGLGSLAVATAMCITLGVWAAIRRRLAEHRRWMWRTYMLLVSAVVIRLIGGLATVAQFDALWLYPLSCWISWLAPLCVLEIVRTLNVAGVSTNKPEAQAKDSAVAPSLALQACKRTG